jgi:photosystem II stability/assembly factor-like uncharacterized protein
MRKLKWLFQLLILMSSLLSYQAMAAQWTWRNPLLQGNLLSVTCPTERLCVAVGSNGTILTSTDSGITWTVQYSSSENHLKSMSCPTPNLCVAVGDKGVLTSTDGGINWTRASSSNSYPLDDISCPTEKLCVAVKNLGGTDGTVLISTDGGNNWTAQSFYFNTSGYSTYSSISCPTENLCVVVNGSTILTSTNGGMNWTVQFAGSGFKFNDINCSTENLCVAVGDSGVILTSSNRGISWTLQSAGTKSSLNSISCPTETFCIDRGINWAVQSLSLDTNQSINAISCRNNRCVVVGNAGTILTTDNISTINTQPSLKADIKPISGKIGDTVTLNLADYFEDSEDGDHLTYSILGDYKLIEFDQSQLPQLKLTLIAEGNENVTLSVTDSQGWSMEYFFKVSVVGAPVCEPASYSEQTQQAYLPAIEIPLFNTLNLYSASLELASLETPSSSYDFFRVKELTFLQTITTANPCHAVFMPNTGILTIPRLQVTEEPAFTCAATLQQSLLQPNILSLSKYTCRLP